MEEKTLSNSVNDISFQKSCKHSGLDQSTNDTDTLKVGSVESKVNKM